MPAGGDESLASSVSSGKTRPIEIVVDNIIRLSLSNSALACVNSLYVSEREAVRLLSAFDSLLEPFLLQGNYSADKLRAAIRDDSSDEAVARLIERCTVFLEESVSSLSSKDAVVIEQYIRFLSVVIDSKFISWYVKSGSMGSPLARLTALMNRYRRTLFNDQQSRAKPMGSAIEEILKRRTNPKADGKVFFHQLK